MDGTQQLLKEKIHEIHVKEQGDSIDAVVGRLFQKMRKQLFKEIHAPIIHMEAKEVYFEDVQEQKRTERFFFFFWPRERVTYTITAKIVVDIEYLEINQEDI